MIRICALDFLNRDFFESDVKLADGKTIISEGDKITPGLILMLYFKEIYVDTPLKDVMPISSNNKTTDAPTETPIEITVEPTVTEPVVEPVVEAVAMESTENIEAPDLEIVEKEEVQEPLIVEMALTESKSLQQAQLDLTKSKEKGPEAPSLNLEEKISADNNENQQMYADNLVLSSSKSSVSKESLSGAKTSDAPTIDLSVVSSGNDNDDSNSRSPVAPTIDLGEDKDAIIEKQVSFSASKKEAQPVKIEEEPINGFLKFNDEIAGKIAEMAVMLANELKYSASDLKDIKNAALNCNIGVIHFKVEDLRNRDFEIRKATSSYDLALKKGSLSLRVLETIKSHARPYKTEEFNLNPTIPLCDVIHIVTAYNRFETMGMPKDAILMKMLELGGNEYNIFALHKFLRLMRENG